MTEQELVEKVAIAISGAPFPTTRSLNKARAALSVIRGALSEPTEEMLTAAIYAEGPMRPTVGEALAAKWKAMIAASPIGEK